MRKSRIRFTLTTLATGAALALAFVSSTSGPLMAAEARIESTWGLEILNRIVADQRNINLPITEWALDGFENDLFTSHRTSSVMRKGSPARIRIRVPVAGAFYPAFVLYDTQGKEAVALLVDGAQRGVAVADWDNNRERLFFLNQACNFKGGETIELRALAPEGVYRTEALLLLREKPAARPREYSITNVEVRPGVEGKTASASVTWITRWPVAGKVQWEAAGSSGQIAEDLAVNNHRILLAGLKPRSRYRLRIVAETPEGTTVSSAWQPFETSAPSPWVGGAERGSVVLEVRDPLEQTSGGLFPVTSGVPFPKGALGSDADLRLLDPQDQETPLQTRVLARWVDGSAKWVLLDFQAQTPSTFRLQYGRRVSRAAPASKLKIAETAEGVEIVTGPLKLAVSRTRFGFPGSVWLDTNGDGRFADDELVVSPRQPGEFLLVASNGAVHSSLAPPAELVLEETGPLRVTVRASGGHYSAQGRRLFAYTSRIHAYAGQPCLHVQHTFTNDADQAEFTSIRSLTLRLPMVSAAGGGGNRWLLGDPSPELKTFAADRPVRLAQHRDDRYSILEDHNRIAQGRRSEGLAAWSDGARTVTLAVRDFWQSYPKDLSVSPAGFELGLCPPLAPDEYADAKGTTDDHRLYYYLEGGLYKLRQGVTKTHDLWLDFRPAGAPVRSYRRVLIAVPPAKWYADTRAFGDLALPAHKGLAARYESAFARAFQGYLENREKNREYGMLNFGDWWGERAINWGNSEYDTQYGFLLQFARTTAPRYFRAAEEVELHNRDVDTVHAHSNRSRIGGMYAHCVGHTGDYYSESPVKGRGITQGGLMVSHTFIEGHLDHYFLTGDRRSLETAGKTADRYDLYQTRNFDFSDCRNAGWHLILSMAMYNADHDRFHLNAAKIIVERVLERQTPDGGWRKILTPGHCRCLPRHHGNAGFMLAVLLTGLKHYEEATGDKRVEQAIIRGARFLINDMWVPQAKAFRYTSCPASEVMAGLNFLLFDGIAYAHQRTGDPRMRQVLLEGAESALEGMRGLGKGFTQYTRVAPGFIGYLDRLQEAGGANLR